MNAVKAYAFLTGLFIGGYSNFFSKIVITGLVLYIVHPDKFDPRRFSPLYSQIYEQTYPYLSKIYSFSSNFSNLSNLQLTSSILSSETNEDISIIQSPLPINNLPPLTLKINKK